MLAVEEIKRFIDDDAASQKKKLAEIGQKYYDGDHDIKSYKLFYVNADGKVLEDTTRSNVKISHPFFAELVDQAVQYILSGSDGFIKSDIPELQTELDKYFNEDEDFIAELSEVLTGSQVKGFEYMYAYKNPDNRTAFQCANSMGVVEIKAKDTDTNADHVIYWYVDREVREQNVIKRIQVWGKREVAFYVQVNNGSIEMDISEKVNPRPHTLYTRGNDGKAYFEESSFIPFFRMDNNKKWLSSLKPIKSLIDDYDMMACGLTNNIQDASEYLVVVSGFQGDSLEEMIQNAKTKKHMGVDENGGVDFKTVDIPYEARKVKLELDEKNIYRFGMGLNTSGLKDTAATTNIAIKAAYSLLDLKCSKIIIRLKQFLRKLIKVVLDEINAVNGTDYQQKDVYFDFKHEIMSNEQENAQIKLIEAQTRQAEVETLLNVATHLDNETFMQLICEQLDIDYEEIKGKLPDPEEAENAVKDAQGVLDSVVVEDEQTAEGNTAGIS